MEPRLNSPDRNPDDHKISGLMQERVYKTPVRDDSHEAASHWHVVNHITRRVIDDATYHWRTGLQACMKVKRRHFDHTPALFRATTLRNGLFSESPSIYWGKHVAVSIVPNRVLIKQNNVIGQVKLNVDINFACPDALQQNWRILSTPLEDSASWRQWAVYFILGFVLQWIGAYIATGTF